MSAPPKQPMPWWAKYIGIPAGVVFFILYAIGSLSGGARSTPARAQHYTVEYHVQASGTSSSANLTYTNETGDTEQRDAGTPWLLSFGAQRGAYLYLAAQHEGSGTVTCDIVVNGVVVKHAESRGDYVIATCSGRL